MEVNKAMEYVAGVANSPSTPKELVPYFIDFQELYDKRLWYQMTIRLEEFLGHESGRKYWIPLYENFILDFEKKVNALALVQLAIAISTETKGLDSAVNFLTNIGEKVKDRSQAAWIMASIEAAAYKLARGGNLEEIGKTIEECEKVLDSLPSVDPVIYASYYRVRAEYDKRKCNFQSFYKNALLFLACILPEKELPQAEQIQRAHDLGIAALLSDTIYNFGDLLTHPILNSLIGSSLEWLRTLLFAFNSGDIDTFQSLRSQCVKQPNLKQQIPFLEQKIRLMALVESFFRRNDQDRRISFDVIAKETRVSVEEVELLVMKALSLKLVSGYIDEIDKVVQITRIQPRVLNRDQIQILAKRLESWKNNVSDTARFEEQQTPDLFVCER